MPPYSEVVEEAATDELFRNPRHPYTEVLLRSIPKVSVRADSAAPVMWEPPDPRHPPSGCRFRTRCPIGPLFQHERQVCIDVDPQALRTEAAVHFAGCHFAQIAQLEERHAGSA